MSKGGGQGSFAQMQEPGMGMDMGGFGGRGPQPASANQVMPVGNSQNFSSGIGGKGGQLAPQNQGPGSYMGSEPVPLDRNLSMMTGDPIATDIQPMPMPLPPQQGRLLEELRPLPQPGGFGAATERFNNLSPSDRERLGDLRVGDIFGSGPKMVGETPRPQFIEHQVSGPAGLDPLDGVDLNRFSGGLGSKGGRSNPYQTDGIVPPTMRGQPLPGRRQFDPIDQPIARPDPAPQRTSRFTDAEHSAAEAQAREILGLPPKGGGGRVYAGGNPNFDERTGRYRPPQYDPRPPFMPGPRPPVFGPPRPAPGRNTQFQMPFFGSPYGRMNPYRGQFSGYGVPTNIASFAQPHYQPYVPPSYEPPPPSMQLPPGQGDPSLYYPQNTGNQLFSGGGFRGGYGGGYGGIGGFGRYNLGLAGSQLR